MHAMPWAGVTPRETTEPARVNAGTHTTMPIQRFATSHAPNVRAEPGGTGARSALMSEGEGFEGRARRDRVAQAEGVGEETTAGSRRGIAAGRVLGGGEDATTREPARAGRRGAGGGTSGGARAPSERRAEARRDGRGRRGAHRERPEAAGPARGRRPRRGERARGAHWGRPKTAEKRGRDEGSIVDEMARGARAMTRRRASKSSRSRQRQQSTNNSTGGAPPSRRAHTSARARALEPRPARWGSRSTWTTRRSSGGTPRRSGASLSDALTARARLGSGVPRLSYSKTRRRARGSPRALLLAPRSPPSPLTPPSPPPSPLPPRFPLRAIDTLCKQAEEQAKSQPASARLGSDLGRSPANDGAPARPGRRSNVSPSATLDAHLAPGLGGPAPRAPAERRARHRSTRVPPPRGATSR
jgi:hypothetical protein